MVSKLDDKILLAVDDSKPGVSEAECALLFDSLCRQDASRTRRESGAGLGLTISKNVVEALGGNIKVMPPELGGLRIEVQWPAPKAEQP